jgi:ACR3 family arsenite transporter
VNALLVQAARHGRLLMILGLVAGIGLPELALTLKPWIGAMIAGLIFLSALRIGPRQALGAARDVGSYFGIALLFQLLLPLALTLLFLGAGWTGTLATALILATAASPISGSPNLAMMTGHDPAPALRLVIIGTASLPLTVLPVFLLLPELGDPAVVLLAAARLLLIIIAAAVPAFVLHAWFMRNQPPGAIVAIDGISAIALGVIVIGLMSAVGPAIRSDPAGLLLNLAMAFLINFALQILVALVLSGRGRNRIAVPLAIVAGNRNMALFLSALPLSVMDPLLLFIGCYQVPMYLTPLLLGRLYRRIGGDRP